MAAPDRPLVERVLDVLVYAPLGIAASIPHDVPRLVADGRRRAEHRIATARWIGELAVNVGRRKVAEEWSRRFERPEPDRSESGRPGTEQPTTEQPEHEQPEVSVGVGAEPFGGYDALPAADLVPLLARLTRSELELIRDYEAATRRRRTVLAKIDQLLGAA